MGIPTRAEAEALLASYELPDTIVAHARGVSAVAAEAARLLAGTGVGVDPRLVEVAALLHDIDKLATREGSEPHGIVGARWLTELGYPELANPVASHPVNCLLDATRAPRDWPSKLVAIADRRFEQRFVSIDQRIDGMAERYPEYRAELDAARVPAHRLEAELASALGLATPDLDRALRAAVGPHPVEGE
jgi:putative nucleotidyltransferase with HDIG domain